MPAATLRSIPARIISFWLTTSASAGTSRNVLMKYWLQRMFGFPEQKVAYCNRWGDVYDSAMPGQKILKFDRTPVARLVSCAAMFGSAALVFDYLAMCADEIEPLALGGLILLFLGTVAAAVVQYGDHIYFSEDGVMYENRLLKLFGRRGRWMRWEDIIEVREIRERILILLSRDGRRMLVDAILGYAIARAEILRRAPHATLTGTLAEE